jgi:uncharacterized protein YjbI with pentapeptide repeats
MMGAWLNLTSLEGANLNSANLSGSTFLGADLTGANLSNSKLHGAMLIGADLSGTDLRGADLTGAVLTMPFPNGADRDYYQNLSGNELIAELAKTDVLKALYDPEILELNEVRLKPLLNDAKLQGTIYDSNTTWPEGFIVPPSAVLKK